MKVGDVIYVKGRGPVATLTYDADELPRAGKSVLRRVSDGKEWKIRGVERWAIERDSWRGCPIGLLLPAEAEAELDAGDEVTVESRSGEP